MSTLVIAKTLLAFVHLLAMAVAIGRIFVFDLQFLRQLHQPPTPAWREELETLKTTVKAALAVLWVTGVALVWMAVQLDPAALANQKLWMKCLTVTLLTVNGLLMHRFALPALHDDVAFLARPGRQVVLLTAFAATSSVTWLFAAFLGIARPWNHTVGLGTMLALYGTLITAALVGGLGWMFALRALPPRPGPVERDFSPLATRAPAARAPRNTAVAPAVERQLDAVRD